MNRGEKRSVYYIEAKSHIIVILSYLVITLVLTYPWILHFNTHVISLQTYLFPERVTSDEDPWVFLWNLWWVKTALLQDKTNPYFTNYIYYPQGINLTFHTLSLANGLLSIPFQFFLNLVTTYNLLMLLSFVLSGYFVYLLVNQFIQNKIAAFYSGLIFTFSTYRMIHSFHFLNLATTQWIPLYILFLFKLRNQRKIIHALITALLLWLNWQTCEYYFFYLFIFTAIFSIYFSFTRTSDNLLVENIFSANRKRHWLVLLASANAVLILLSLPCLITLYKQQGIFTKFYTGLADISWNSADLLAYIIPSYYHLLGGNFFRSIYERFTGNFFEKTIFIGYNVLFLSIYAIINYDKKQIQSQINI